MSCFSATSMMPATRTPSMPVRPLTLLTKMRREQRNERRTIATTTMQMQTCVRTVGLNHFPQTRSRIAGDRASQASKTKPILAMLLSRAGARSPSRRACFHKPWETWNEPHSASCLTGNRLIFGKASNGKRFSRKFGLAPKTSPATGCNSSTSLRIRSPRSRASDAA